LLAALDADQRPAQVDAHHNHARVGPHCEQLTESQRVLSPRRAVEANDDREIRTTGRHTATVGPQRGENIRRLH
jgi:hypothetical protein